MAVLSALTEAIVKDGWFDHWGAPEWLAVAGLVLASFGIGIAVTTLDEARRQATNAARDARRILRNELTASLELEPLDPDSQLVDYETQNQFPGHTLWECRIRNVGRYRALIVDRSVTYNGQLARFANFPRVVPATGIGVPFKILIPWPNGGPNTASAPVRIHAAYEDGTTAEIGGKSKPHELDICFVIEQVTPGGLQVDIWRTHPCT